MARRCRSPNCSTTLGGPNGPFIFTTTPTHQHKSISSNLKYLMNQPKEADLDRAAYTSFLGHPLLSDPTEDLLPAAFVHCSTNPSAGRSGNGSAVRRRRTSGAQGVSGAPATKAALERRRRPSHYSRGRSPGAEWRTSDHAWPGQGANA